MMHTYRKQDEKWQVGYYAPVTWFNPLFGPRDTQEWETVKEVNTEDEAQELTAKLNGK